MPLAERQARGCSIKELQRHRFGRKAEALPEEQTLLGLEEAQQVAARTKASQDETAPEGRTECGRKRRTIAEHYRRICRVSRSWSVSWPS